MQPSRANNSIRTQNSLLAWLVTLSAGLLFFYEFIQLNAMNSLSGSLIKNFHLSAVALGDLSAMYFIANASLVFIAGNILDRFSPRRVTLAATLLCVAGTIGFALSQSLLMLEVSRFIVGTGGAFCFLCGMRVASRWFTPNRLGAVTGVLVTMAMLGGMVAQTPLTLLIEHFGWRHALLLDGVLGILIFIFMFFIISDSPEHKIIQPHQRTQKKILPHIMAAISKKQNWLSATYSSCLNLPIFILGALWGDSYLQHVHGLGSNVAASICGMLFFGSIIGSPVIGALSDLIGQRKLPMIIGAILSSAAVILLIQVSGQHIILLGLAFFFLGFISSTQVLSYSLVNESNSGEVTGTAVSLISMMILAGGATFQPYFGHLMDTMKNHHTQLYAYQHAIWLLPVMMGIGLLCSIFLKETYAKRL